MGYKAVEAAVKAVNGEKLEKFIDSGCSVVNKDNAQERLDTLKATSAKQSHPTRLWFSISSSI